MRTSKYFITTLRSFLSEEELISHQLMLRSGMIRKSASGIYSWLPIGLCVLKNLENIIRKEMNSIGAIEISMPILQPTNLWEKSGRLSQYGSNLLKITDRNKKSFILSPTNEEAIINIVKNEIHSYKQLPINLYQIKEKFRDEIRPSFGVIRSKEFLMKDAYSFHVDRESLNKTYKSMCKLYNKIFSIIDLDVHVVEANPGFIGGDISHEFHAKFNNKKYRILSNKNTISNKEKLELYYQYSKFYSSKENIRLVRIPKYCNTISRLAKRFLLTEKKIIKVFLVHASKRSNSSLIALAVRGDHKINLIKIKNISQISYPLVFANEREINRTIGTNSNLIGPINLSVPIIVDKDAIKVNNFATWANSNKRCFLGVNWIRDVSSFSIADICGSLKNKNNTEKLIRKVYEFEVGHIFQLDVKYSELIKATVNDKFGNSKLLTMGCYGLGISRIVAAVIEQHNDFKSIIWPESLSPFIVAILPINIHRSSNVKEISEHIYRQLQLRNVNVLFDDRHEQPGVMFADMELIGIPHQIIVSDKNLINKKIEYKNRLNGENQKIEVSSVIDFLCEKLNF